MAVYLGTMITSTIAGSFTRGCAARDLQILMLIEECESAGTFDPEKLSDAMLAMLHARDGLSRRPRRGCSGRDIFAYDRSTIVFMWSSAAMLTVFMLGYKLLGRV